MDKHCDDSHERYCWLIEAPPALSDKNDRRDLESQRNISLDFTHITLGYFIGPRWSNTSTSSKRRPEEYKR